MAISLVAVDLSKSVFQLSLADAQHHIISRKRLNRTQFHRFLAQSSPVRVTMEACGTAHYWGRTAQLLGHEVKLLHAKYVKAYVRRTKTDAADADALILADRDESLHPIPVKPEERQALQGLHRIREQLKSARTARICEARALLAEFGVCIPKGARGIGRRLTAGAEHAPDLLQAWCDLIRQGSPYTNCYSSRCGKLIDPSAVSLPTEAFQLCLQFGCASSYFGRRITAE